MLLITKVTTIAHKSKPVAIKAHSRKGWFIIQVDGNLSTHALQASEFDVVRVTAGKFQHLVEDEMKLTDEVMHLFTIDDTETLITKTGFFLHGGLMITSEPAQLIANKLFEGVRYVYPDNGILYIDDVPRTASVSSICGGLDHNLANDRRTLSMILKDVNGSKFNAVTEGRFNHRTSPLTPGHIHMILGARKHGCKLVRVFDEWKVLARNRNGVLALYPFDELV